VTDDLPDEVHQAVAAFLKTVPATVTLDRISVVGPDGQKYEIQVAPEEPPRRITP
jgi:hypothetical protein